MIIAYISQEYPPSLRAGGIASYLKEIASGMHALGHEVTIIAASDDTRKQSEQIEDGIRVVRLSGGSFYLAQAEPTPRLVAWIKKWRTLYRFRSYRKRVLQAVQHYGPFDVIEVAEFGCESLYLNAQGTPIIYRLHTASLMDHHSLRILPLTLRRLPYYWQGRMELKVLRERAHYITSCSEAIKQWTERAVMRRPCDIRVIYNPIRFEQRDHAPFQATPHSLNIFYAGTLCDWKGVGDLYETGAQLHRRGIDFTLTMAGKGGSFAATLGAQPWLRMLGRITREEVLQHYRRADVVCFPSWWENMPMVCIEAMMCGALVIGSAQGGMAEIITDGVNGFLLPPRRPELWSDKIAEVCALLPARKQEISQAARQRIQAAFSLEVVANEMAQYYKEVITHHKLTRL